MALSVWVGREEEEEDDEVESVLNVFSRFSAI